MSKKEIKNNYAKSFFDQGEDEYIGNMWGWNFSYFGLALLIICIAFITWGQMTGRIDITKQDPIKETQQALPGNH